MNNKPTVICSCPCSIISGYGYRSRDFLHALFDIKRNYWDIKVISQRWGDNPKGLLDKNNAKDKEILDNIISMKDAFTNRPDGLIMISMPNEMKHIKIGKYFNWIVTAGVEVDVMSHELLEGCNEADLIIFSSKFSEEVAKKTTFDKVNNNTKQKVSELKLVKPTEVLFEGMDIEKFKNTKDTDSLDLSIIKESFCFLSVAQWLSGTSVMEDRKNLGKLIRTFLFTFKDQKNTPALVLKTSTSNYSIMSREYILDEIENIKKDVICKESLPNIYLIHGALSDGELNLLYNNPKIKCLVSIGNEGFGRPALEFSCATYKPIIASPYSGHIDFLNEKYNLFVGGELIPTPKSVQNAFLIENSCLFSVDNKELMFSLKDMFVNYKKYYSKSNMQNKISRKEFSLEKMTDRLKEILDKHVPEMPKNIVLKLPKLEKIDLNNKI